MWVLGHSLMINSFKLSIKKNNQAFTIVELLVVVVVIGILAAITIVSYSGIQGKAIASGLQFDLSSDVKLLKMYNVEYGYYPSTLDVNNCPQTPTVDTRYCLKSMKDATLAYTGGGQTFRLVNTHNPTSVSFYVTEGSVIAALTLPKVDLNTSGSITGTAATIGATVTDDGGSSLTDAGMCWGLTTNPTTNCISNNNFRGILSSPATVSTGLNTVGVTISPDGKFLYAVSLGHNTINIHEINESAGSITAPINNRPTSGTPYDIVISSDGLSAYATIEASDTIAMYSRNVTSGELTPLITSSIAAGNNPKGIAMSFDGLFVYAVNELHHNVSMYSRNTTTGELTALTTPSIATGGLNPINIAISRDGKSVYVANSNSATVSIFNRNVSTGLLTAATIPTIATSNGPQDIVISNDGTSVYTANYNSNNVSMFSRNINTGELTALSTPNIAAGSGPYGICISNDDESVYIVNYTSNTLSQYSRNKTTGLLAALASPTIGTGSYPTNLITSNNDKSVYVMNMLSNAINTYSRNPAPIAVGVAFKQDRTGLPSGSTIHYRGYATTSTGTGYSASSTFVTP